MVCPLPKPKVQSPKSGLRCFCLLPPRSNPLPSPPKESIKRSAHHSRGCNTVFWISLTNEGDKGTFPDGFCVVETRTGVLVNCCDMYHIQCQVQILAQCQSQSNKKNLYPFLHVLEYLMLMSYLNQWKKRLIIWYFLFLIRLQVESVLGTTGGLLGLYIGFSLITVVEVFILLYDVILFLFKKLSC